MSKTRGGAGGEREEGRAGTGTEEGTDRPRWTRGCAAARTIVTQSSRVRSVNRVIFDLRSLPRQIYLARPRNPHSRELLRSSLSSCATSLVHPARAYVLPRLSLFVSLFGPTLPPRRSLLSIRLLRTRSILARISPPVVSHLCVRCTLQLYIFLRKEIRRFHGLTVTSRQFSAIISGCEPIRAGAKRE